MSPSADPPGEEGLARAARLRAMGTIVHGAADEETAEGWAHPGGVTRDTDADAALRREVPPHHGG